MSRLAALALAAALALGLVGCDTSSIVPGGSGDVMPNPAASQTGTTPSDGQDAAFQMHFIDVGQALSVLVECDGQFMLYDGGNVDDGSLVVSYLQSQGVEQLEYVFCSHAHEDHVGGLAAALAYFPACHVYSPVTEASTKCFKDFVKYTQQQNLQVEVPAAGTQWALGSATVTMLGPVAQYEDTNDTSIVLRIDYGATSFLLTGDMEADAERDLVNSGANLKVDVLQVGHHGSSTSTSYVFLNAVLPEMGIISCGVNNKYGHPHEETLSILRDAGVGVYRTDLLGTITVSSDTLSCYTNGIPANILNSILACILFHFKIQFPQMSAIYTCLDDRKMIHLSQHHFMRMTGNNGIHTFYPRKPLCIFFFNHIGIRHVRANVHQQHHHIHFPFLFKTGRNLNACRIHRIYEINSSNIFRPCLHSRVRSCQSYKSNLYAAAILKWLHHHLARLQPFQWSMVVFCYNISCDIIHAYRCCINQVRQSPVKFMIAYCRHLDIHFPKHLRQRTPP